MWLGLSTLDWIVVFGYLLLVTALGVMAYRKVDDMTDFFMGGRRFGKVFMMFFAFGAGTSSEQANSVVAGTWRVGLAGIWWQFLWLWATPFYWIVAPVLRRMRALTTSDFFEARFDRSTATLYSIWGMIMAVVFIAGALYGSGKMVDALTGGELERVASESSLKDFKFIPVLASVQVDPDDKSANPEMHTQFSLRGIRGYEIAILGITVLFVAYGMAGGLGAAVWTDLIQGILTIAFSFLLLPFVFSKIGGFAMLNPADGEPIKEGMFDLVAAADVAELLGKEPITFFYVFMLSLTALTGIVVQPHIMGVCGAGKTEFEGRFGFTFGNFIKRFCTIAWTFTALACIAWYLGPASPLKNSDKPEDKEIYAAITTVNSPHFKELTADIKELNTQLKALPEDGSGEEKARIRAELEPKQAEFKSLNTVDLEFADRLFGRAAHDILPGVAPGLVGLLLASLLAAMMSTCDAQMIVGSGLFTENIYKRSFNPNASQKHYLWVGRFAGIAIVLLALVLQTTFTDVVAALRVILKTPAMIGISLWIGIAWRGWTPLAVWASSIAATAAWWVCANQPALIGDLGFLDFMMKNGGKAVADAWTMVVFMSTGVLVGLLVSFVTRRTSKEKLDHFFTLMRTPVRSGEHIAEPCSLPEDPLPPIDKLIDHPDIEIPKPTKVDLIGFALAWVCVALIIGLTYWLASPT